MSDLDVHPRLLNPHKCIICETPLINRRQDSKTCSSRCRTQLYRQNKENSVLVKFRLPLDLYTNLVIAVMSAGKGVGEHLQELLKREHA